MKFIHCDGCQKHEGLDGPMEFIPAGWVSVRVHGDASSREQHFCSAPCAVIALTDHLTKEQRPMLVK